MSGLASPACARAASSTRNGKRPLPAMMPSLGCSANERNGDITTTNPQTDLWCQNSCGKGAVHLRNSAFPIALLTMFTLVSVALAEDPCPYLKSRSGLAGFETGGPYKL